MKYFKDSSNTVFAFEADGSQDVFIPAGLVAISNSEADALRAPKVEELAASVKAERDFRLAACDWTQLRDVPDATAALWQPYRQALRNLTAQPGFPASVTWPLPPQ